MVVYNVCFCKQKTAYEVRISDWSSDVCSSDLKRGDVVTKINGKDVTPSQTLSYIVSNTKPGTRIPIEVVRDGKTLTLNAVIGTRPPEEQLAGTSFDPEDEQAMPDDPKGTADTTIQNEQIGRAHV